MQTAEPISHGRLTRLSQSKCLLGEPDIICIRQVKTMSSFFGRDKKIQDLQENYINGLIFPTTAHFSSFISSRYKAKDPGKYSIKAKLYMFDAYGEKDLQIEISIPGSLEAKAFNLKGQPLPFSTPDYERAYFSSFLRSLYPMNYPGIVLYPLMNRLQILRPIIKNFIVFSLQQYQLRDMDYSLDLYRRSGWQQGSQSPNISLEILMSYCLENNFGNLLKIILDQMRRHKSPKFAELEVQAKLREKKYGEVIHKTAEKLLIHGHANHLKEFQIRSLFELKKYSQIAFVGRSLIESGGTTTQILQMILHSLIELDQDQRFLKTVNLVYNIHNLEECNWRQISHINCNSNSFCLQQYVGKLKCLSEYPELCFPFDNTFLNRLVEYQGQKSLLQKNTKEGFTLSILQKIQESLKLSPPFYKNLVFYVKKKGWNSLVKNRSECFWLEHDFAHQEQQIRNIVPLTSDDRFSFFEEKFQQSLPPQEDEQEIEIPEPSEENPPHHRVPKGGPEQQFDGNLSEHECSKDIRMLPKCSARINTARKVNSSERKIGSKIQCNVMLQQMFFILFNDLKLQNSLQNWQEKLKETDSTTFSKAKKEIAAMILLKKGFLNRKLQQSKKCEQAFQKARGLSDSFWINIVASYQLMILYIDNKNAKGVEYYLVELLRLLKALGIDNFDIVPEWAKPILQFVVQYESLSIIKNLHPIFRGVFALYLRSNWSEEEVNFYTQIDKK